MPQSNWSRCFRPLSLREPEHVDRIIHAAGHIKLFAVRVPGKAYERIRALQRVLLDRILMTDVIDKNILVRQRVRLISFGIVILIESAGQDQKGFSIRLTAMET